MAADPTFHDTPRPLLLTVAAALALLVSLILIAPAAQAQAWQGNNAARVDSTIRPCFGMLIGAELRGCGEHRHYRTDFRRYGYYGGLRGAATIDCDRASTSYIESVARSIRSYGVLYLKARNRSCVASLDISRSITIVGQGFGPNAIPVLVAPDGEPCLRVSPNADKVILKNVYISSPRAANSPCIESAGKELTLQDSMLRYQGDNAAVHVAEGRFNMSGSHIIAKTRGVALAVQQGEIYAENSEIATTAGGVYAVLDGDSQILGVSVQQLADWHGFERGDNTVGLDIKLDSADSILTLNDMEVKYFASGIDLDGAGEALISHSLISRADHAITTSVNRLRVMENTIIANEIGIDVENGTAYVGRNQIANVRTAGMLAQAGGEIRAVDNAIDPNGEGCPTLRWGNIDPAQRVCRPWFKGSAFDVPGDAEAQYMFDQFWPHMADDDKAPPPPNAPPPGR